MNLICRGSLVGFGLLALLDSVNAAVAAPLLELPCQRTVVSRSATNMPPYSFLNDKQQLTGYRIEFMQQLFARLGCHLEILTDSPWKRALMLLESGEIDVLMNASNLPSGKLTPGSRNLMKTKKWRYLLLLLSATNYS